MIVYVIRRLLSAILIYFAVTGLTFSLFFARGGIAIATHLLPSSATPEQVRAAAESLGLLRPVPVQYLEWLGSLLGGSLGRSYSSHQFVVQILSERAPVTLSLIVFSLVITVLVAVPLGIWAATRGGIVDRILQLATVVVQAIPGYWLALILVIIFGLTLRLVPATGYVPLTENPSGWFSTIILPSIAISLGSVAFFAAQIRGAMLDVLRQDYIRTLRSRGLGPGRIVLRHGLRNAAPGVLTLLGLQIIGLIGGTVIVERIYALPGLGSLALAAGKEGDLPTVMGTSGFVALVVIVVNFATDIINGLVNPKARMR